MAKRIQAYFRTEDEAEGARTALIPLHAEVLNMSALTDPLGQDRRVLVPLMPPNNLAGGGSTFAAFGGAPPAVPIGAADAQAGRTQLDAQDSIGADNLRADRIYADGDLDHLRYVMELKTEEDNFNAVVHTLRSKHAYVEIFE